MIDSLTTALISNLNARGWFVGSLYQRGPDHGAWRAHLWKVIPSRATIAEAGEGETMLEAIVRAAVNAIDREADYRDPVYARCMTDGIRSSLVTPLIYALTDNLKARERNAAGRGNRENDL